MSDSCLLDVQGLTVFKEEGSNRSSLVKDFYFRLLEGEAVALVGDSGSGKTLASLAIMKLLPYGLESECGHIIWEGKNLSNISEQEMHLYRGSQIAYVFQDPKTSLNPLLKISELFEEAFQQHYSEWSRSKRLEEAKTRLSEVELHEKDIMHRYPHQLSGGQRQRISIALSLAGDPKVLIADEITTSLDPDTSQKIILLLKNLCRSRGMALVFISHDIALTQQLCDRTIYMKDGAIVEPPQNISFEINSCDIKTSKNVLIEAQDLSVAYSHKKIFGKAVVSPCLEEVSFNIYKGETLAVIGKSGSGKSTLARTLCGLADEVAGNLTLFLEELSVDLRNKSQLDSSFRRHISMIFQDPISSLNPALSIQDSIAEPLLIHEPGMGRQSQIDAVFQVLDEVGLDPKLYAHKKPRHLSGGQCQRAAIARALILNPKLVVCDEAVSSLDVKSQYQVLMLLKKLQEERQISYLFISHDPYVVKEFADRVLVIEDGKVVKIMSNDDFRVEFDYDKVS